MLTVNANTFEIVMDRADDQTVRFTVTDSLGVVVDVSAGTFKFTVKKSLDDVIGSAKFQKTSPAVNGIDLTLAATGIVDVLIEPVDTSTLFGIFSYDLEMVLAAKVRTLRSGLFVVKKEVSTPGTAPASSGVIPQFQDGATFDDAMYLLGDESPTRLYHKFQILGGAWTDVDQQAGPPPF